MATTEEVGWQLDSEKELWRSILAPNSWHGRDGVTVDTHPDAYWYFVNKGWGAEFYLAAHPEEPQWLYEPIHRPFCAWFQKHILAWKRHAKTGHPERYHIAVVLPRGYGKTVSATKSGALWSHLDEPDTSTLFLSSHHDLSKDILKAVGSVISGGNKNAWFSWLYGDWRAGGREWTKESFKHGYRYSDDVSEPSFDTSAVEIGMTGYHHRQHWWDDPIYKNKLKDDRVAYMRSVHSAVGASFNACMTNGLMVFVLTRYLDDDVAGRYFKNEGIATWSGMDCPSMMYTEKVPFGQGNWHVYFYQTEDELTGEPTHPKLWTKRMIADAKRRDPEDFACQQQNNPGSGDRAPLLESQLPFLFMAYPDFLWQVSIKWATIHIDTAFKRADNIRTGDDSAIVAWLSDARDNGVLYLDSETLCASNEWREEDFNKQLVSVCLSLRRRGYWIRAITDEQEPGGKAGTYKNRILGILAAAGINLSAENFIVLNRKTDKKARIRTSAGAWAEGYVRILLHKGPDGNWIIPKNVRRLFNQIIRVDAIDHDDMADAQADGFISQLWARPAANPGFAADEGATVRRPGDELLKTFGRAPTNEELLAMIDERKELEQAGMLDGVRGGDYDPDPSEDGEWIARLTEGRLGL